jgi:Zn finger protein HypA/HybF involved in hydrogenase expression
MSEIYSRQKIQENMQKSDAIAAAFGKLVSGKAGYKAVIEKKPMVVKCKNCQTILDLSQKFCHECGAKADKPSA